MNKKKLKELKELPIEKLESMKSNLKLQLIKAKMEIHGAGFNPPKRTPTCLVRDIRRQIARVNTILNQKKSIFESIEKCKSKPSSKRRERRFKGKMKELKVLKGGK